MSASLTDTLCTRCGLCCDGSLFADVELRGHAEADGLALLGLDVEDDDGEGALLVQPCAALRGRRCGIYAHRPGCCRTFECRLLQDARAGAVSVETALERIAEALRLVRRASLLVAKLGGGDPRLPIAERAAEAIARTPEGNRTLGARKRSLVAALSGLEKLLRTSFLGRNSKTKVAGPN